MGRKTQDDEASTKETVVSWFSGLMPSRYHLFGPLSVLLVMHLMADGKRSLTVSDLCLYVPKPVVAAAIPALKGAGYIITDGVGITIRRTPVDDMKERT